MAWWYCIWTFVCWALISQEKESGSCSVQTIQQKYMEYFISLSSKLCKWNSSIYSQVSNFLSTLLLCIMWCEIIFCRPKTATIQKPKDDAGIHVCSPAERKKVSLSYQTQCTGLFTVGPLDYCGIACLVKERGESKCVFSFLCSPPFLIWYSRMLVCNNDPRENLLYAKRNALTKETAKLRGKGTEKVGLSTAVKRKVFKALPLPSCSEKLDSENQGWPRKKPCRSADRDLVLLWGSNSSLERKENINT